MDHQAGKRRRRGSDRLKLNVLQQATGLLAMAAIASVTKPVLGEFEETTHLQSLCSVLGHL